MPVQRVVIYTGGRLGKWALRDLRDADVLIGADRGALFMVEHGISPDIAIGDFDSVTSEQLNLVKANSKSVIACDPVEKDFTDTEMALERALAFEPAEIVVYGALGTRFDHSLANVHLLVKAQRLGVPAVMCDAYNEIRLVSDRLTLQRGRFTHVSLLPLSPQVTGITLRGFRYPLSDAELAIGQSLGISNVMEAQTADIEVRSGLLLVIQSRD
jgi:thiamine pyrophosphokinase